MQWIEKDRITNGLHRPDRACMREFVLLSRQGKTSHRFNISDLGRAGLDLVARCISSAFCVSGHIRRDVVFHIFLSGPPSPPVYLRIDGTRLRSLDPSEKGVGHSLMKALKSLKGGTSFPGISASRGSLESFVREHCVGRKMYILEENGKDIDQVDLLGGIFILGDKIGLPKREESFLERFGARKLSLGSSRYFSSHCVVILNYELDRREKRHWSLLHRNDLGDLTESTRLSEDE